MSGRSRVTLFDDRSSHLDRFGLVLALTMLAIVALSLVDLSAPSHRLADGIGSVVVTLIVGATLLLAMRASGLARKWQRVADAIVIVVIVFVLIQFAVGLATDVTMTSARGGARPLSLLILSALTPAVVVRRLLQHRTVTTGTLFGAISAFLLLPIAFTYAFLTIGSLQGTPFFGHAEPTTSFMYFSLCTITTVGYGDLVAVSPFARLVATAEAVSGQVYLVTFVAMLVGLRAQRWASGRRDEAGREAGGAAAGTE